MNPAGKWFFLFLTFVIAASQVAAQQGHGLTPLRSTRADVVSLFGQCADEKSYCEFRIENEDILIEFSKPGDCTVAPDTVLSIQRELLRATTFAALGLDTQRFKSFDPSLPPGMGYRAYIDEATGLLLKTYGGEIFQINQIAARKDWRVCPTYYRQPREFVRVVFPHVPRIESVECPRTTVAGETVVITANYARTGQRLLLFWGTTGGRILDKDSGRKIVLDTTGVEEKEITVTAELNDGNHHTAAGSCTIKVSPRNR